MNRLFNILFCCSFLLTVQHSFGQVPKSLNLPKFEQRAFHFGFSLGVNTANMEVQRRGPTSPDDSLLVLSSVPQSGFNIGIISSLTLYKSLRLRFIPSLIFAQRNLEYSFKPDGGGALTTTIKPIESTYIQFPLLLKYKSKRLNNFAAYMIAGGEYNIDLASNEKVDNDRPGEEIVVKIKRNTTSFAVGAGADFYLQYFKFAIEAKMNYTLNNVLIQDNTVFSTPIERLKPRMFVISFLFEG